VPRCLSSQHGAGPCRGAQCPDHTLSPLQGGPWRLAQAFLQDREWRLVRSGQRGWPWCGCLLILTVLDEVEGSCVEYHWFPLRWESGGKQSCGSSKDSSSSAWFSQGRRHVGGKLWLHRPIYFHGMRVYQVRLYSSQKAPVRNNCEAFSHNTMYNWPRSSRIG